MEAHVKTNNLFKVTQYLGWNWTHSFLCIPPTLLTGSTARRLSQHTSHGQGPLTPTQTVKTSPLHHPFHARIHEKSSPALSLIPCEQAQEAKSVIWPSAWVCTFNPRWLSLPLIFFQQYFLNHSTPALCQTDILQLLNQSRNLSSLIPKDSPATVFFFIFGARLKIHFNLHLFQPCNALSVFLPAFILKLP